MIPTITNNQVIIVSTHHMKWQMFAHSSHLGRFWELWDSGLFIFVRSDITQLTDWLLLLVTQSPCSHLQDVLQLLHFFIILAFWHIGTWKEFVFRVISLDICFLSRTKYPADMKQPLVRSDSSFDPVHSRFLSRQQILFTILILFPRIFCPRTKWGLFMDLIKGWRLLIEAALVLFGQSHSRCVAFVLHYWIGSLCCSECFRDMSEDLIPLIK